MDELNKFVGAYDRVIRELANIACFEEFGSLKCAVDNDKMTSTQDEFLGVDLYEAVHPLIARHERELSESTSDMKKQLEEQVDQANKLEGTNEEHVVKNKISLEKYGRCEGELTQLIESHDSVLAVRQREVAVVEQQVQSLQATPALQAGTVEEQVASLERECAQLEARRRERQEEFSAQKETSQR